MDFEGYKAKIQKASKLIEGAKCPEDILNNKEINLANDFQYICLSSSINGELVNEVIARLAQNGNESLVEQNIKEISMGMWKYLFNKNKSIKEIFIKNFTNILDNTGIMTYREIEGFLNDKETRIIIYQNMKTIIRKLCTYDRASLIASVKTKEDGVKKIKEHLEQFFQKGEFDISTTYSKVLIELENIPEISTVEILEACSKNLVDMLDRETAIDNETNVLLNLIYNLMEETQMYNEQRALLQKYIDSAILENFYGILDKANYDKETIRTLKQFPCTFEKFDKNKNLFIEKSNKLIHMTKIYDLSYGKENKAIDVAEKEVNDNNNAIGERNMEITNDKINNNTNYELTDVYNDEETEIDVSDCHNLNQEDMVVDLELYNSQYNNDEPFEDVNICNNIKEDFSEISNDNKEFLKNIETDIKALEEYAELLEQSKNQNNINAEDVLNAIIKGNLYDTDKIIDRVMKKNNNNNENNAAELNNNIEGFKSNVDVTQKFEIPSENKINDIKNDISEVTTTKVAEPNNFAKSNTNNLENNILMETQEADNTSKEQSLIVKEDNQIGFNKFVNIIKRLMNKIKSLFSKFGADRIGD